MVQSREKIEKKIKELNEIRHVYKRDFELVENNFKEGKITKDSLAKRKEKFEKQKEKIRKKIVELEAKLHYVEK